MAISVILGADPIWSNFDLVGRPFGGGELRSFSSLNPTVPKAIYQDPAGTLPYPVTATNGILFNENGNAPGPFYFKFDSADPTNLYNLYWYDAQGNLVAQTLNYSSTGTGSGGGGGGTTYVPLKNLVVNNVFWRNVGSTVAAYPAGLPTYLKIAPSNHDGFVTDITTTNGAAGEDVVFIKNNTNSSTDKILFPTIAANTFAPTDTTPAVGLNYVCGDSPAGETFKIVQWPIVLNPNVLSNQVVTVSIWGILNSGLSTLGLRFRVYNGSGGAPSADSFSATSNITLTGSWKESAFTITIPNTAALTPGDCGDGALFLQVLLPTGSPTDLIFTKPEMYLTTVNPGMELQTYDEVDAIANSPRTGDVRTSLNSFAPFGWVAMNDGTIGDSSSGSSTRANVDTFALYDLIWRLFSGSPTLAPIFTSAGAPSTYGASSVADFTAHKRLSLTKAAGRVFANIGTPSTNATPVTGGSNTGTSWAIGQNTGNELHTQQANELVSHNHTPATFDYSAFSAGAGGSPVYGRPGALQQTVNLTATGGGVAMNIQNPLVYMNVFIKL